MQWPPLPKGLSFSESFAAEQVQLLVDETWVDAEGQRQVRQEIFDSVFQIIDEAEQFILLDFFLVNDFLYEPGPGLRPLSRELTDKLLEKRKKHPSVEIVFITDPLNTVYDSIPSPFFHSTEGREADLPTAERQRNGVEWQSLETCTADGGKAGVRIVWTDINRLRDSNPMISKPWRLFVKPWGTGPGNTVENPIGKGRVSLRSALKLINFKANHRKLIVSEKSLLVTSANPHSASSAHWNMALRIDGAGQTAALKSESAILKMSGAEEFKAGWKPAIRTALRGRYSPGPPATVELLTERKIKEKVLELLDGAEAEARIDLTMFYLADSDIIRALIKAKEQGCTLRVILDPNKDAFGRVKNGIPNRQSAARLVKAGIPVRWADTHGEQCHVKTLYVEHADQTASLLLGSANYTRRNLDNFNAECNLACTAPTEHSAMKRARETFERWWNNQDDRTFTTDYKTYEDNSIRRKLRARLMEATGLSSF